MEPTDFSNNRAFREWRRFRIWELHQQGWKQTAIATALGITQGAVSQTLSRAQMEGTDALKSRPVPGVPSKLTPEQKARIPSLLLRGAEAFGFSGDVWTCERIAIVIAQEFEVTYHRDHVRKLLKSLGWSYQKPKVRATQRNENAITKWKEERLPHLKKGQKSAGINSCL
jgi:transposase